MSLSSNLAVTSSLISGNLCDLTQNAEGKKDVGSNLLAQWWQAMYNESLIYY